MEIIHENVVEACYKSVFKDTLVDKAAEVDKSSAVKVTLDIFAGGDDAVETIPERAGCTLPFKPFTFMLR